LCNDFQNQVEKFANPFSGLHTLLPAKVARARKTNGTGIQDAARKTLRKLFQPLSALALDCGLSVGEVTSILRDAAVRGVAGRQLEDEERINISGIAAVTGLSRAEIARVLRDGGAASESIDDRRQNPANRILAAWHRDPMFLTSRRLPAALKLYGRGATFEGLVRKYGRGLPARAVFDQLTRIGAIELRASQEVFPKMFVAVDRRMTPPMLRAYGRWATDLPTKLPKVAGSAASPSKIAKPRAIESTTKRRRNFRRAV
jgi:hypothetical protein